MKGNINGIIIDGILHMLKETQRKDCIKCSLRKLCDNEFNRSPLCWISLDSESEIKNIEFRCIGKIKNIEIEKEK